MGYELLLVSNLQILSTMNMIKKCLYVALSTFVLIAMTSCEPSGLNKEDVFITASDSTIEQIIMAECAQYNQGDSSYT